MSDWQAKIRGSRVATLAILLAVAVAVGIAIVGPRAMTSDDGVSGAVSSVDVGAGVAPQPGDAAPQIQATLLDGTEFTLGDRPTWVMFVATWCPGCRTEMPDIQQAYTQESDVEFIALYVQQSPQEVSDFAKRLGLTFPQAADRNGNVAGAYGVRGLPTHVFIGADGIVKNVRVGAMNPDQINEELDAIR